MACLQWVDKGQIECEAWGDELQKKCSQWKDEGSSQCSKWADEGSNQCSKWADEGYKKCCTWIPCKWFCHLFVWVSKWVCKSWYWVSKWVCKTWHWVAYLVCVTWVVVVHTVCLFWSWVAKLVCVLWDNGRCLILGLLGGRRRRGEVRKVFVLMLENRSFDHMLGLARLRGMDLKLGQVRDADDLRAPDCWNESKPGDASTRIEAGPEAAFKLNEPQDVDPPHEFLDALEDLCGSEATYLPGQPYPPIDNKGFVTAYATAKVPPQVLTAPMKAYSRRSLPILTRLADEFTTCDAWFSSLPGPTFPNRFFMYAASSGGLDDSSSGASLFGNTLFDGYKFNNGTIFDRLDDACLEWRVFAGDALPVTLSLSGMTLNWLQGRLTDFEDFADAVADPAYSPVYTFIEPDYGNLLPKLTPGDFTCGNSQHPMDDVTRGERLIKTVYETIRNSPHWEHALLLVTWDEHGGFYDHVAPPPAVAPGDGVADVDNIHHGFAFDQLGVRVPAVVIGARVAKGGLDGTVYDHSSLLRTLEELFSLRPLTERDAAASSLLHLFAGPLRDAPTDLGEPADSGFVCEDDEEEADEAGAGSGAIAPGEPGYEWMLDPTPVSAVLRGFKEVALLKALTLARGRDREQIRKEYLAAQTRGGARHFMRKAARLSREVREAAVRRGAVARLLLPPPKRDWPATPIHAYRIAENMAGRAARGADRPPVPAV